MGAVRVYLAIYNVVLLAGWLQILVASVKALQESGPSGVYAAVEKPLQIWQTAALLEVREHWLVTSLTLSWAVAEVIRYSFFGLKEAFGYTPYFLLWLRYTTFLVLFFTGICSEIGLIYSALPFVRMPNKLNFGFDFHFLSFLAIPVYIPGFAGLYMHMLKQRKKALAPKPKTVW